jgi:hypothetical protein
MEPDGMLMPKRGGFDLKVRAKEGESAARRRWTMAHELAHTLFYSDLTSLPRRTHPPGLPLGVDEERACDLVAEYLLMPTEALRAAIGSSKPGVGLLRGAADTFGVSIQALSRALIRRDMGVFLMFSIRRDNHEPGYRLDWAVSTGGLRFFPNMRFECDSVPLARCLAGRVPSAEGPIDAAVAGHRIVARSAEFAAVSPGRRAFCFIEISREGQVLISDDSHEHRPSPDQLTLGISAAS